MTSTNRRCALAMAAALALAAPLAAAAPASAETNLKMVLNWKYQGPQGWFFLADDRGYFKAAGLNVTLDQGNGSGAPIPLVANGTYDVGFGDINALIEFAAKKPDEAPIAVYVMYNRPPFTIAVAPTAPSRRRRISRARRSAAPPATARSSCSRRSARSPRSTAARSISPICSRTCASRC